MVGDRGQERYRQRGCSSVTKVNLIHDLKSSHRWPPRGLTGQGGMELSGPSLKGLESHRGVHLSKLIDGSSSFRVLTMKPLDNGTETVALSPADAPLGLCPVTHGLTACRQTHCPPRGTGLGEVTPLHRGHRPIASWASAGMGWGLADGRKVPETLGNSCETTRAWALETMD